MVSLGRSVTQCYCCLCRDRTARPQRHTEMWSSHPFNRLYCGSLPNEYTCHLAKVLVVTLTGLTSITWHPANFVTNCWIIGLASGQLQWDPEKGTLKASLWWWMLPESAYSLLECAHTESNMVLCVAFSQMWGWSKRSCSASLRHLWPWLCSPERNLAV